MATSVPQVWQPLTLAQRPAVLRSRRVDPWLLGSMLALVSLGVVMVLDASFFIGRDRFGDPYVLLRKHVAFLGLAVSIAAVLTRREGSWARKRAYPALLLLLALLIAVLIPGIGQVRGGARRWLPLLFLSFEPSEVFKPIFVIYLAHSLTRKREQLSSFAYGVLPHLLVAGSAIGLLLLEPDFGAAALIAALTLVMLFVAGARPAQLAVLCASVLPAGLLLIWRSPYRWARIRGFLDPWGDPQAKGFQLVQSFLSFGSGGFFGVGLGNSNQKLFYLPEGHTDFIFALIGEELGFAGAMAVLACFAIIALRGFRIAIASSDGFTRLLAFGLTFLLTCQAAMNVGVVLGLLPTKGLALPFVSYGGSALLASGISAGLLLGISREVR
jgi:cell division protein FtsW